MCSRETQAQSMLRGSLFGQTLREKRSTMKIRTHSLTTLLCAATVSLLIVRSPAQAGFVVTLQQVGPNVVATGNGAIDLTGLTFDAVASYASKVIPMNGFIETGAFGIFTTVDLYSGVSGPTSFGTGSRTDPGTNSGDAVGMLGFGGFLEVPQGYVSGAALSDSSTYDSTNFTMLGVTPGTFKWTWGTGPNQNFTLIIGGHAVPDRGSTLMLLSIVVLCLLSFDLARRRTIKA